MLPFHFFFPIFQYYDSDYADNEIELAIKNGAFAIILDTNVPIIDNEIAWIKVKNICVNLIII